MYKILEQINKPKDLEKLTLKQLNQLSQEVRDYMLSVISKNGGHVASNFGIVELTIALLKVFNFDKDKIVFDVGHQSYPYKILTGRRESFKTLRKYKGISGFPKREESKYDFFDVGHSSNSISVALGMAKARDIKKENFNVISLVGDGALTGGMAYEGLNDLGYSKTKMIVIINDNQMSISKNVGGLSNYLTKIRLNKHYNLLKKKVHNRLGDKNKLAKLIKKAKHTFKSIFVQKMLFEDLGIRYIGPVDGHNIEEMIKLFNEVKNLEEPVVIHVVTKKGKGYIHAEEEPNKFHGISPFDMETGEILSKSDKLTYSKAFGDAIVNIAKHNKNVVAITAAMTEGTGLKKFAQTYPERFFDIGIAEQHAVSFAAGLATQGLQPVFAVYSTFLQRGFDQILIDVCMQNLPVVFMIDRAGLVGNDGKTHQGIFDISYLSMMPNLTILAPKTVLEIEPMLKYALALKKPVAIRYPRGGNKLDLEPAKEIQEGKWEIIEKGEKLAIIATGKMVEEAIQVKEKLKEAKINPMVINALSIKPLDILLLKRFSRNKYNIVTLEDNVENGGLGTLIESAMRKVEYKGKILKIAHKDKFIEHGGVDELMKAEKMDTEGIVKRIMKWW
ncbi:MAG: 1-deoxy-D-xylulose-5-phosphate synthase [Clostridiales bacterium]|nr:1-deoxy-D-xylulose-5-phosphate synthase [Clostridiales bacterium]